jgi:hypothetical protein
MRHALPALLITVVLSGCSFGVGAGAEARLGGRPEMPGPDCDSFESCDLEYRDALARAERCHEHGDVDDCDEEDRDAAVSYEMLHEQTQRELDGLRAEAQEKDAALTQADQAAEAAHSEEQDNCSRKGHPPEPPPAVRHGNGWFESEPAAH